ncbi:MAG TPA: mechanosensitive ion channel domain-containing protein [Actinomycetota bacterium]|nr:mechanosensitive ion channel domain-containing protein [Actinomycetota bacterium]
MIVDRRRAARPHLVRACVGLVVLAVGIFVATKIGHFEVGRIGKGANRHPENAFTVDDLIALIGVVITIVGGIVAVRSFGTAVHAAAADRLEGRKRGTPISFLINFLGYLVLIIVVLSELDIPLDKLLLGGALTGVVIGIAAQQTLGNFFAGIVLLLVRPFAVGETIYLKGTLGEYEGVVTDMSLFYVHMSTERGPVMLPNAGVLASAVGPGARAEKQAQREENAETKELER